VKGNLQNEVTQRITDAICRPNQFLCTLFTLEKSGEWSEKLPRYMIESLRISAIQLSLH
jgi:hypothetical protein